MTIPWAKSLQLLLAFFFFPQPMAHTLHQAGLLPTAAGCTVTYSRLCFQVTEVLLALRFKDFFSPLKELK